MTTRKSRDRKIIAGLIVAVIVELILLLTHSGVIHFGNSVDSAEGQRAGVIAKSHNYLRRRSLNSLVWENSASSEVVNYYDSILTLKESTASLKLDNNTEVELSENTLITIDPPDEAHAGEIRLRFVRGNLAARNPYAASKIGGGNSEQWTVELKPGAEVELREIGEKGVEVQLKSGEAKVQTTTGEQALSANQILRVDGGSSSRVNLAKELRWLNPPAKRIYLHGEVLPLPLDWDGAAQQLLIQTLGQPERTIALSEEARSAMADLSIGQHRIYLRSGDTSSQSIDVQVWRAPLLHLLSPLPRDRVDLDDPISFVWQRSPEVVQFQFKISGENLNLSKKLDDNTYTTHFSDETDAQWYVEGIDAEGFVIPPLYRYPMFVRSRPFAPPKLKTPNLRAPASQPTKPEIKKSGDFGLWLWSQIFPQAHADEGIKIEAVFSWEPVEKADQYIIEISETADFRNPIINKTISTTEFAWRGFALQMYYWRVAAGSSRGRMGVFSDPVSVNFEPLRGDNLLAAIDGVLLRKIIPENKTPSETKILPLAPSAPVAKMQEPIPYADGPRPRRGKINLTQAQENWRPIFLWQPNYNVMQVVGSKKTRANLTGGATMAFGFEFPWRDYRNALWMFDAAVNYYSFTPDPKIEFPFQQDLNWLEFDANATRYTTALGMGIKTRQILSLQRKDYEEVSAHTALWFGPQISKNYILPRGEFNIRLSPIFSRDGQALNVQPEWRCRIGERFITGIGADGLWILQAPNSSLILRGFVTVGFPF